MKTSIGLCGATGKTPELQIGQVKTVDYTQKASVEITGTRENPILNFNIPKGKDGAKLIVREYFNGDIQILNNLNELPEDTNSDSYGKTVMSVNGIKQLLEKINDVLTKANANTNAIGSLTSTVQGNKSDIETKLNNFKSDTDTRVQSINQTISELEQTIETKLNEELTKQVKALQDENKKLNDMIFENSLKENFEGSDPSISDTSNGVAVIETIKGQTTVTDAPTETNPNYKNIESTGEKEGNKISILSHNKNLFNINNEKISYGNMKTTITDNTLKIEPISSTSWSSVNIKVDGLKKGVSYEINCQKEKYHLEDDKIAIFQDQGNICVGTLRDKPFTVQQNIDTNNLYLRIHCSDERESRETVILKDIMIREASTTEKFVTQKIDKKEILVSLNGGLKSLPNGVCDTIEQREDGFYLVQRVEKLLLTGSFYWINSSWEMTETFRFDLALHNCKPFDIALKNQLICNQFNVVSRNDLDGNISRDIESICAHSENNIGVSILKNKLNATDKNTALVNFKQWIDNNPTIIYYELKTPIETKLDINNLNLKTFKDLTYITSENNIRPVLKGQATKDITTVIKNLQSKGAN